MHHNWGISREHVTTLARDEMDSGVLLDERPEAAIRVPIAHDRVQSAREDLLNGTAGVRR